MAQSGTLTVGQRAGLVSAALGVRYLELLAEGQTGWAYRALHDARGFLDAFQATYTELRPEIAATWPSATWPTGVVAGSGFAAPTRQAMQMVLAVTLPSPVTPVVAGMPSAETALGAWYLSTDLATVVARQPALVELVQNYRSLTGAGVHEDASRNAVRYARADGGMVIGTPTVVPSAPGFPVPVTPPTAPGTPLVLVPTELVLGTVKPRKFPLWAVLAGVTASTVGVAMFWKYTKEQRGRRR